MRGSDWKYMRGYQVSTSFRETWCVLAPNCENGEVTLLVRFRSRSSTSICINVKFDDIPGTSLWDYWDYFPVLVDFIYR